MEDICPFKKGENVTYNPSARGRGLEANSFGSDRLVPGQTYRVEEIQKEKYVLVEGYTLPGGGLYWTEFSKP